MVTNDVSYLFASGRRSIFAEIYLPRRVATQGIIFNTLSEGLDASHVRAYLKRHVSKIMRELVIYRHWFDPERYGDKVDIHGKVARAKARMEMCDRIFFGRSMYEVDGVFYNDEKERIDEERTQVLRLMFRFQNDELEKRAREAGHPEVYRAIQYWILSEYGHTDNYLVWDEEERERFLARHVMWNRETKKFARVLYQELAPKVAKWIADCGLFVFGYVVREYWQEVVQLHRKKGAPLEDEIWVASIFHLNINVMEPF